ncbi:DUF943 family protein [Pantoea agglomerans]|jgi:hypothetical protein|uniref:DUF943 family protein n=1 Tax=Pantoea TaxID=53335 RepID=UPI00177D2974|nr:MULTISPECIES: DUF943 family protein [Pantoea]MBD8158211.1 DUF943 family protein [Pantoea agglomerans]MBD8232917.1 DUF943 family protein [Pantoea agglomerans]MCW0936966.1 DUF943 family protein [Pantoea sp. RG18]
MFKYKRIGAVLILLISVYCIWIAVRPAKIVRVDNGAVFVEHLPMTTEGKLKWWLENKDSLQNKYHIINTPDNFTVIIMNFDGYEKLPTGTRDGSIDDYTCFDDTNGEHKKCVYNSIALVIRGSLDRKAFINIGDKTYIQSSDGRITLK